MTQKSQKALLIVIIVLIIVGITGWRIARRTAPAKTRDLTNVTITAVDVAKGTAEIEFDHPKTGKPMRLTGRLAPGGQVLINGQPARLADVRARDLADVRGRIQSDYSVEADEVRIRRPVSSTTASQPTSTKPTTTAPASAPAASQP